MRNRRRYLTKGNYNLTRLGYINKLYPDARFIIMARHPVWHIASMMKQDDLFSAGLNDNPRGRAYLDWVAHHEFGPDKRPIPIGDDQRWLEIVSNWQRGNPVRAWALHWNSLYSFALEQQRKDADLQSACLWTRYEDLCEDSSGSIERMLDFCVLNQQLFTAAKAFYVDALKQPDYYTPSFNEKELGLIWDVCGETAQQLGYTC